MENRIIKSYSDIIAAGKSAGHFTISVAAAEDEDVLQAVKMAQDINLADAVLVGDENKIKPIAEKIGLKDVKIEHEPHEQKAAKRAVALIREKKANILMKGLINSNDFLKAVVDSQTGLRTGALLSHLASFEVPGQPKLLFLTDGGLIIKPDLNEKKGILINAITALERIGIKEPKTAILAANEKVNPRMQSTVDAQALVEMRQKGEITAGILEGPISLDVAVSRQAARHKGINSSIAGDVDLFLVPDIDAGNLLAKSFIYFAAAQMAGLVLGASCPIVMTSRAETAEGKLYSLALACLMV